jgi:hypothetical protein
MPFSESSLRPMYQLKRKHHDSSTPIDGSTRTISPRSRLSGVWRVNVQQNNEGNSVLTLRYQIQDVQERTSEQYETQRSLREVRHALLNHSDGHLARLFVDATELLVVRGFRREIVHQKRTRMNRRLRDEPVRRRHAKQASKERGHTEQRKVVMEAPRFTQRKLRALRDQRLCACTQ